MMACSSVAERYPVKVDVEGSNPSEPAYRIWLVTNKNDAI